MTPISWCAPTVCADGEIGPPTTFARVSPGDTIELRLLDATAGAGQRCTPYCSPGNVQLQPLSCNDAEPLATTEPPVLLAAFSGDNERIRLDAPSGSYLLSAFVYWNRADGTTGDVLATTGIQLDGTGPPDILDATEISCQQPELSADQPPPPAAGLAVTPDCGFEYEPTTLSDQIAHARMIFLGIPTGAETTDQANGIPQRRVRFTVTAALRGSMPPTLDVYDQACHGGINDLQAGETYLVFAFPTREPAAPHRFLGAPDGAYRIDDDTGTVTNDSTAPRPLQELIDQIGEH